MRAFALAGGAALIAARLVDRRTKDLDFFTDRLEGLLGLLPVLEESLRHADLKMERRQAQAGFARLAVSDGAEVTEVDLCLAGPPTIGSAGTVCSVRLMRPRNPCPIDES